MVNILQKLSFFHIHTISRDHFLYFIYYTRLVPEKKKYKNKRNEDRTRQHMKTIEVTRGNGILPVQRLLFYFLSSSLFLSLSLSLSFSLGVCGYSVCFCFPYSGIDVVHPPPPKKKVCVLCCQYAWSFSPSTVNICNTCEKNSFRRRCIIVRILPQRYKRKCVCCERMGVFIPDMVSARFVARRNKRSRPL